MKNKNKQTIYLFLAITLLTYSVFQFFYSFSISLYKFSLVIMSTSLLGYYIIQRKNHSINEKVMPTTKSNNYTDIDSKLNAIQKSINNISKQVANTEKNINNQKKNQQHLNDIFNIDISIISSVNKEQAYVFGQDISEESIEKPHNNMLKHIISHIKNNGQAIKVLKPVKLHTKKQDIPVNKSIKGNIFDFPPNLINYN